MTSDNLQLIDVTEEDDYLIAFHSHEHARILDYSERRRQSLSRKSLGWDSAFFTSAGLLNPEELTMVNKGFKKSYPTTQKDAKRSTNISAAFKKMKICSQNKLLSPRQTNNKAAVERSDNVKPDNKIKKAQDSKKSQSTSFTSPTVVKVHRSYESSSSACSKSLTRSIKSKVNPKNMKLVNSTSSDGPKRMIKSSGLHTPSPKTGFQSSNLFPSVSTGKCLKIGKNISREHDGRKLGSSCNKLKPVGQIPKVILKNRKTSLERKYKKDDRCTFQAEKENVLSFEDQVNDLSRQLEVIDLDRNAVEVKGQQDHISSGEYNLQLIDFSEEDDYLIPFPERDSLEDLRLSVTFDNPNKDVQSDARRQSLLRRSLAWDNAFSTSAGLLNPEELLKINKGFKKATSTQKDGTRSRVATKINNKVPSNNNVAAVEGPESVKMEKKTRILQDSKMSGSGSLPKSTSFTSSIASYKDLSKSITRKVNSKKMKLVNSPSSVLHFPLSSSSTSPASSIDGWLSDSSSSSSTPVARQKTVPVFDFKTPNSNERKFTGQNSIKSSGLRMPSPRIGFFDKEPGSIQDRFRFRGPSGSPNESRFQSSNLFPCISNIKVGKNIRREHDERKVGSSCSKLKPKEILKMNLDQKDDGGKSQRSRINDLSRWLEVIELQRDVVKSKVNGLIKY